MISLPRTARRSGGLSVREYWDVAADINELERKYSATFASEGYDALLLPPVACVATPHRDIRDLIFALSYSFLPNLLHYPAGVVPVTTVREDEQHYNLQKIPPRERDSVAKLLDSTMR